MGFPRVVHGMPLDVALIVRFRDGDEVAVFSEGAYDVEDKVIYVRSDVQGFNFLATLIHELIEWIAYKTRLHWIHSLLHMIDS